MGHILTAEGIQPDPEKIEAITLMEAPKNVTGVQRFVGFVTYLSKFLPLLSEKCEPLRRLTMNGVLWDWGVQQQQAFNDIKKLVTTVPVLKYYTLEEEVTIQCDASSVGLGATLLQNGQPVAFASRALTTTEQNYAQIEKECLAIVFSCDHFYQYLCGREVVHVESDHKPLEVIFKKSILSAPKRLQRMLLRLQKFNLQVRYKKGAQMYIADLLSRSYLKESHLRKLSESKDLEYDVFMLRNHQQFCEEVESLDMTGHINVTPQRLQQIRAETENDNVLQALKITIVSGWPAQTKGLPAELLKFWPYREELSLQDGVLLKGSRVIIPGSMYNEMLNRIHAHHMGIESCIRKARDVLFWPTMGKDIKNFVMKCSVCNEYSVQQQQQPLIVEKVSERPWEKIALDLFTIHGKDYLVMTDYFSNFWEIDELSDTTAATIVECCKKHFSRHGVPMQVNSDCGGQFTGHEFKEFASSWEFKHHMSSPYHSQGNGKAESGVKNAKRLVKKVSRSGTDIWKAILEWRNTPTEGMNSSPVQRLMSRRTRSFLPIASELLKPCVPTNTKEKLEIKQAKAKYQFDKRSKDLPPLQIGDFVRVQPSPHARHKIWRIGKCVKEVYPRSYIIDIDGTHYRRNRKFLRKTIEDIRVDSEEDIPHELSAPEETVHQEPAGTIQEANNDSRPAKQITTRSGRVVKTPAKYKDYVMT